jgi:hypothetical protein
VVEVADIDAPADQVLAGRVEVRDGQLRALK